MMFLNFTIKQQVKIHKVFNFASFILLLVILLILSSCKSVNIHGQYLDDQDIKKIRSKSWSKEEMFNNLGYPNFVPDYTDNTVYYLYRTNTKRAWFRPKVIEQRIVRVNFDLNGKATKVEVLDNTHNESISVRSQSTKAGGTSHSGVQKFVRNVGRFNQTTGSKRQFQQKRDK